MLEFESKLAAAVGNTIKVKVTDKEVNPKFLYYWVQHLYNSGKIKEIVEGSVSPQIVISRVKQLPFYNKTLGDVASFSTEGEDFDFEIQRTGQNAGKVAAASDSKKDALANKYKLDRVVLDKIADVDPTPNGVYTEWLTKAYKAGGRTIEDLTTDFKDRLAVFERLKNSPQFRLNNSTDINSYPPAYFITMIDNITREDLSKKDQLKDIEKNKAKYLRDGVEYLGRMGHFDFYRVTTVEASMLMSTGTHWCTQGESHARNYLSKAPLYVITTHDETYQGDEEEYMGSDKFAQYYVPPNSQRIECQDIDGNDVGEYYGDTDEAYVVTDDQYWSLFAFLAKYDKRISSYMDDGIIIPSESDYESHRIECDQCGTDFDEHEAIYSDITNGSYCDLDCFKTAHEDYIKEQMDELLPPIDDTEELAAKAKLNEFINSPDSPEAHVFNVIREAVEKMNEKTKEGNPNATITAPADLTPEWHLGNLTSSQRCTQSSFDRVFGGVVTREQMARTLEQFKPLYDASKSSEEKFEDMVEEVTDNFNPHHTDVRAILVDRGLLDPNYVKKSSGWNNTLLHKKL